MNDIPVIDTEMQYRTRDGQDVAHIFLDRDENYPVIGLLVGLGWRCWTKTGHYFSHHSNSDMDLLPTGKTRP